MCRHNPKFIQLFIYVPKKKEHVSAKKHALLIYFNIMVPSILPPPISCKNMPDNYFAQPPLLYKGLHQRVSLVHFWWSHL